MIDTPDYGIKSRTHEVPKIFAVVTILVILYGPIFTYLIASGLAADLFQPHPPKGMLQMVSWFILGYPATPVILLLLYFSIEPQLFEWSATVLSILSPVFVIWLIIFSQKSWMHLCISSVVATAINLFGMYAALYVIMWAMP